MKRYAIAGAILALALAVQAQTPKVVSNEKRARWAADFPAYALGICAQDGAFDSFMARQRGEDTEPILARARECLDASAPGAVKSAGDNADMRAAVKDAYAKALAWSNAGGEPEARAMREALARLAAEAKLAGKWPDFTK